MTDNNELKEVGIKNRSYHYLDEVIDINEINLDNIALDQKSSEGICITYHALLNLYMFFYEK